MADSAQNLPYLVSHIRIDFAVVLRVSKYLEVGPGTLTVGWEAVDVRIHERIESVNWSHGVEIGSIDNWFPTSKILLDLVASVAPYVVDRIDSFRQSSHQSEGDRNYRKNRWVFHIWIMVIFD